MLPVGVAATAKLTSVDWLKTLSKELSQDKKLFVEWHALKTDTCPNVAPVHTAVHCVQRSRGTRGNSSVREPMGMMREQEERGEECQKI